MMPTVTVPAAPGGWWHSYVCPTHGVELDPVGHGTAGHHCRHGCVFTGEPYASAWRALEHQRTARRIRLLAHRAGEEGAGAAAADEAIALLEVYAEAYRALRPGDHDGAAGWMVPGRMFHQALSECIWATNIAGAAWTLTERTDADRVARLAKAAVPLLSSLHETAEAARDRTELRSNYVAWFDAAGALTTGALRRLGVVPVTDSRWVDGPMGIHAHLRAAVLDDGWQWEGSTYYHAFVLLAALYALRGTDPADLPDDVAERLRGMVRVLTELAGPDGVLPALHDSPYRRGADAEDLRTEHQVTEACELAEMVGLARGLFGPGMLSALGTWCADTLEGRDEATLLTTPDGWFAGPPLLPVTPAAERERGPATEPEKRGGVVVFDDAGYAALRPARGHWQAILDFGPHGGGHGHLDKLALYVQGDGVAWQPDPGITPYATSLRARVYRATRAHPTFSVDELEQAECAGALVSRSIDDRAVVASADDAYPGVRARRHLRVLDDHAMLDILELDAGSPDLDERTLTLHLRPAVPIAVQADDTGGRITWTGGVPLLTLHACSVPAALTLVPGWAPADEPTRPQHWVDWTATATAAVFATLWRFGSHAGLNLTLVAGSCAVEVHRIGHPPVVHPLTPGDQS